MTLPIRLYSIIHLSCLSNPIKVLSIMHIIIDKITSFISFIFKQQQQQQQQSNQWASIILFDLNFVKGEQKKILYDRVHRLINLKWSHRPHTVNCMYSIFTFLCFFSFLVLSLQRMLYNRRQILYISIFCFGFKSN